MAAGDYLIHTCPQCKSDNRTVGIERYEYAMFRSVHSSEPSASGEVFAVRCSSCGLEGQIADSRTEAIGLWNKLTPLS